MASNFRIKQSTAGNALHLKLSGSFDGTAAFELLYAIQDGARRFDSVLVDTAGLSSLPVFGREVFMKNYKRFNISDHYLMVTGDYADGLKPTHSGQIAV